eukprot:CAMPEP_0116010098 /NCGR_PEP_ID=MMETSP0321-20121206/3810_1 /TAXON_ID=163516 /ORGANISM="Leptocylindrus danicus var. danicus, Strain B650" /LENGTH=49 /DNA_ID=CAMNT_0003479155 /DNA_START=619 /DNA_END=768 /DNA_ORIENTATION=-
MDDPNQDVTDEAESSSLFLLWSPSISELQMEVIRLRKESKLFQEGMLME